MDAASGDGFLTVDEVAAMLRLNPQTIRNMIDRGELPAVRVGSRRVRVVRSDLDAFLAERRRVTKKSPRRVGYDDAAATVTRAFRARDQAGAAKALRELSRAALSLARELEEE